MPDDFDHRIYDKSDTRPLEQNNGGFAPDDEFGDDFDDFEAGGEDEDFGDFDDGFEEPPAAPKPEPDKREAPAISTSPFVSSNEYKASCQWMCLPVPSLYSVMETLNIS